MCPCPDSGGGSTMSLAECLARRPGIHCVHYAGCYPPYVPVPYPPWHPAPYCPPPPPSPPSPPAPFNSLTCEGEPSVPTTGGINPDCVRCCIGKNQATHGEQCPFIYLSTKDNFASPFCSNCPGYPNCNQEVTKGCHFTALGGGRRILPPRVHDPNCGDQYHLSNPGGDTVRVLRTDSNADGEKGWGWNLNFDICKSCQRWTGKGLCVDGCLELSGDVCLKWG